MPSTISVDSPTTGTTILVSFWDSEIKGKIVNLLNQLAQGTYGSTSITTTGTVTAGTGAITGNLTVSGNITLTGNGDFNGDVDVDGTLETDAITLAGAAINTASGICTLDSSSIVKGKRLGTRASKSIDTVYQAATDLSLEFSTAGSGSTATYELRSDSSNPPTTVVRKAESANGVTNGLNGKVKKGEYYNLVKTSGSMTGTVYNVIPEGD